MKIKDIKICYEPVPATQEQLDDIFNFILNKIEEYESVALLEEVNESNK